MATANVLDLNGGKGNRGSVFKGKYSNRNLIESEHSCCRPSLY